MKLSVIIPCHPNHRPTLPRTLQSLKRAAQGLEVETVVVDDTDRQGPSWARNRGLERATGDLVFFVDADDTVRPDFFRALAALLTTSGADFVLSSFSYVPLRRAYDLTGNAAIREAMLPAFFGYSFADVERWNRGGSLTERREQGSVYRSAFRRAFLERHAIRFDETLRFYEDAPFMAECAARAERVVSSPEIYYDYAPGEAGALRSGLGSPESYWAYKFAALRNRKGIAARVGGNALDYFAASAVFSALELFRARRDWRAYAADPFVRDSIRRFPRSLRHPLAAAAVSLLNGLLP